MTEENEEIDEVESHDKQLLRDAVATLMKHYDFVQILTGSTVGGTTRLYAYGDGNLITRIGHTHIWLAAVTRDNGPSAEDDFE